MTDPLDWDALVREARRRRQAEGLTQQAHAALAGVSRDTIRAFDLGERTLTLEKALAILNAVGLVAGPGVGGTPEADRHAAFVRRCWDRWGTLVADRPANDPARLPHGRVACAYFLADHLSDSRPEQAIALLDSTQNVMDLLSRSRSVSGWSPFHVFKKPSLRPVVIGDEVECWLGRDHEDRLFYDAPYLDFWRVSTAGDFFLLRGYQEDGADSQEPGTFIDMGLPVWRLADVIEHAVEVALNSPGKPGTVSFQTEWQGLKGRHLVNWVRPTATVRWGRVHRCRVDTVRSAAALPVTRSPDRLRASVLALVRPFYAAFDLDDPEDLVAEELDRRDAKLGGA